MKNIVICCDGTSNDISGAPTNVLRMFRSLVRSDEQLIYYDSGVGTIADPSMKTDPGRKISKSLDMAIGASVKDQACNAYRFLTKYWNEGDRIFLFGFSRGAYSVRALAGMIHALGLPRIELEHLHALGWSIYSSADFKACANFKYAFSRPERVAIHFAGVWDTVSSFGFMTNFKTLPYTANNPSIDHVFHAVAMHEKRVCFKANLFRPDDQSQHNSFEEVWFKGAHCDVGGGYDEQESGLAKVALEWMYDKASGCDVRLNQEQVDFYLGRTEASQKFNQCKPDPNGMIHQSTKGFLWNLVEFLPRRQWNHDVQPERMSWYLPNLYRGRKIPDDAVYHESVGK